MLKFIHIFTRCQQAEGMTLYGQASLKGRTVRSPFTVDLHSSPSKSDDYCVLMWYFFRKVATQPSPPLLV